MDANKERVRAMHESNRTAWNEGAAGYNEFIGDMAILPGGGTTLKELEVEQLGDLHGWCKRAIHLQCASGADTLSLVNLGAAEVVGVDISDVHIANARHKTELLGFPARWYRCDLLDTPAELNGTADLVYTGKGALNWLQELEGWARVVFRLLKPAGRFYLFESHPITWLWKEDAATYEINEEWSYFRTEPEPTRGWGEDYLGNLGRRPEELAVKYERLWPVSSVINSLLDAGLRLERFTEHARPPFSYSFFPNMPRAIEERLPQSFALRMSRPAAGGPSPQG
jgi:SAM-dependent methyltransferase